jgi:hypothetical protein
MADIKRFDELAQRILIALYEAFPAPHYIDPKETGLSNEEPSFDAGGGRVFSAEWNELDTELRRVLIWLIEHDLVHDRQYRFGASHILTSKGLSVLARLDPRCRAPAVAKLLE